MCLGIPGEIISIESNENKDNAFISGRVRFASVEQPINLSCVPEAQIGDYVVVHAGVAISQIDPEEAKRVFQLIKELGEFDSSTAELDT